MTIMGTPHRCCQSSQQGRVVSPGHTHAQQRLPRGDAGRADAGNEKTLLAQLLRAMHRSCGITNPQRNNLAAVVRHRPTLFTKLIAQVLCTAEEFHSSLRLRVRNL